MLSWLRSRGRPTVGASVKVTTGPYAGRTGVVQALEPGGYRVFIDECCQPVVPGDAVSLLRTRDVGRAAREAKLADARSEMVRLEIDSRDLGDGF